MKEVIIYDAECKFRGDQVADWHCYVKAVDSDGKKYLYGEPVDDVDVSLIERAKAQLVKDVGVEPRVSIGSFAYRSAEMV